MTQTKAAPFDWAFLFQWLMATAMGLLAGWLLLPGIALVSGGLGVVLLQSLALQGRMRRAWRWIPVSAAGWLAAVVAAIIVVPPGFGVVQGALIGLGAGLAQWWLLRQEVQWAGWWAAVSCLAWATALALGLDHLPRVVLAGSIGGTVTGVALEVLLRAPRARAPEGSREEAA